MKMSCFWSHCRGWQMNPTKKEESSFWLDVWGSSLTPQVLIFSVWVSSRKKSFNYAWGSKIPYVLGPKPPLLPFSIWDGSAGWEPRKCNMINESRLFLAWGCQWPLLRFFQALSIIFSALEWIILPTTFSPLPKRSLIWLRSLIQVSCSNLGELKT